MKTPKGVNSMIEIQLIDEAHKKDICLKNDSFPLYGNVVNLRIPFQSVKK